MQVFLNAQISGNTVGNAAGNAGWHRAGGDTARERRGGLGGGDMAEVWGKG